MSYGLALPGVFLYSGDTKPIPEVITSLAPNSEIIFHDLSLSNQPSHTFIGELAAYTPEVLARCYFYHLKDENDIKKVEHAGYDAVRPGQTFNLQQYPEHTRKVAETDLQMVE